MRFTLLPVAWFAAATSMLAQPTEPLPRPDWEIVLYPRAAPGSEAWNWKERTILNTDVNLEFLQNVVQPSLLYYAADPAKANGTAVIIAPGGGGVNLTIRYEGTRVAEHLRKVGVACFILKYRLIAHPTDTAMSKAYAQDKNGVALDGPQKGQNVRAMALADGEAAVKRLRAHAADFGCDPHRIGIVGFSAGGEIACHVAGGPPASRPDFFAPIYGANGSLVPTADSPPVFLAVAADDEWGTEGSLALYKAWRAAKRPAELHIFQTGGHGFLVPGGGGDHVLDRLEEWMRTNGWLTPVTAAHGT
jgi:acetyl esterase/lipase